jgi:hypothetical protein
MQRGFALALVVAGSACAQTLFSYPRVWWRPAFIVVEVMLDSEKIISPSTARALMP